MAEERDVVDTGSSSAVPADPTDGARTIAALQGVFPGITPDKLSDLAERAKIRDYVDRATICAQGAFEDTFFVILDGRVEVWVYELGEAVLLTHLTAGESVGELELLMDSPRDADVVAAGPVTLLQLTYADIDIERHPEAYRALAIAEITRLLNIQRQRVHDVAENLLQRENLEEIFVCHSRADEEFAKRLARNLQDHRVNVWLDDFEVDRAESQVDHRGSGPVASRQRQIGEALDRCRVMVLVMSPDSMESGDTEDEWNYYLDTGKTIIPILHRSCRVPYRLNKYQYVDFETVEHERALDRLIATINSYYADAVARVGPG